MAANFGIVIDKNSDGFGLKLAGDFDATSAYELDLCNKEIARRHPKASHLH